MKASTPPPVRDSSGSISNFTGSARRLIRHAIAAGENRLELLNVELQEERERVFRAAGLLLATTALTILTGIALTVAVVVLWWPVSRVWPAIVLTLLYAFGSALFYRGLKRQLRGWESFPETLRQLRRDSTALTTRLE